MAKHSRLQQLTFYKFISDYFESLYLDKIVSKLENNVSLPQRNYIDDLIKEASYTLNENTAMVIALIYSLHVHKKEDSYIGSLIEELIEKTKIEFEEEEVIKINHTLQEALKQLNLPKLKADIVLAKNIAKYSELFRRYHRKILE